MFEIDPDELGQLRGSTLFWFTVGLAMFSALLPFTITFVYLRIYK